MEGHFNTEKNKSEQLEIIRKEVEKIVDKLGLGIDQDIKETVAIFRAMDFPTSSSCSGHTNDMGDEGYGLPYVEVYAPAPKGWIEDKTNKELREKWKQENVKYRKKIIPLLEDFNKKRTSANDVLLHISDIGSFSAFRIESIGVEETRKLKSEEELVIKIKQFQEEMKFFTEFLKDKFLKGK